MISILSIILPLILLIVLIWNRVHIIVSAIICAALMALFSRLNVYDCMMTDYMSSFVGYIKDYWFLFFLGATFGKAMQISNAAEDLANLIISKVGTKRIIPVLCVTTLILAYGGVSCYVIVFVMYPIALNVLKKADLPRHLIPAVIAAGSYTAVNLGPGSPAIVNNIPIKYLNTSATVLPLYSCIIACAAFLISVLYCMWQENMARKHGEHFTADESTLKLMEKYAQREHGNGLVAIIPLLVVIVPLLLGIDVIYSLLAGYLAVVILYWKKIDKKIELLNCGVNDAVGAILATSAVVGFGGVAKLTEGFQVTVDAIVNMKGSPLISFALGTALLSGACGSGSGGLALALETLAPEYLAMGINPGVLHKIASCACLTLGSLPHNGAMVTLLFCCGLTHKEGYKHLFAINVVCMSIILGLAIILANIMYPI